MALKISQIGSRGIPGHRGGVERVVEAVAPRLAAHGYDVKVYCADWADEKPTEYKGVSLVYSASLRTKYFDTLLRSFTATLKEMFGDADVVHYHGSGSAPLALLARLAGKKTVVTVHGRDWQRRKWNGFGQWFLKMGERAAVRVPHRTIVVGRELKRALDKEYGADVTYIANGAEAQPHREPDRIKAYGVNGGDYILFLARLVPEKQCHVLVDAYRRIADKKGVKLIVAGPEWHSKDYVETLHAAAEGDPNVIFTGEVDEETLEELYSNCISYVLPSEVEGMSLSLLTAMAFGACIIASDIPANADLAEGCGVLFPVGDVEALKTALEGVINDRDRAAELRRLALAKMNAEFDWDRVTGQWGVVYDELCSGKRADPSFADAGPGYESS